MRADPAVEKRHILFVGPWGVYRQFIRLIGYPQVAWQRADSESHTVRSQSGMPCAIEYRHISLFQFHNEIRFLTRYVANYSACLFISNNDHAAQSILFQLQNQFDFPLAMIEQVNLQNLPRNEEGDSQLSLDLAQTFARNVEHRCLLPALRMLPHTELAGRAAIDIQHASLLDNMQQQFLGYPRRKAQQRLELENSAIEARNPILAEEAGAWVELQQQYAQLQAQAALQSQQRINARAAWQTNPNRFLFELQKHINSKLKDDSSFAAELMWSRPYCVNNGLLNKQYLALLTDFLAKTIRSNNSEVRYGISIHWLSEQRLNSRLADDVREKITTALNEPVPRAIQDFLNSSAASASAVAMSFVSDESEYSVDHWAADSARSDDEVYSNNSSFIENPSDCRVAEPSSISEFPLSWLSLLQRIQTTHTTGAVKMQHQWYKYKGKKHWAQMATHSYTPGQAFLLSKPTVNFTPAEALAYLMGPELEFKKNSFFPNYQGRYQQLVYSKIDRKFIGALNSKFWTDSSRRCFESVLAFETLKRLAQETGFITKLKAILAGLLTHVAIDRITAHRLELISQGEDLRSFEPNVHRTYMDLSNAIKATQFLRQASETQSLYELLHTSLMIWACCMGSEFLQDIFQTDINPVGKKGREYFDHGSFIASQHLGTFKHDDFLPAYLQNYFSLQEPVFRGADFSRPIFALKNDTQSCYFQPLYANTLMCQGSISGLLVALLGRFVEVEATHPLLTGSECPVICALMSALIYGVGGHSFVELITTINLPSVAERCRVIPFYAALQGEQLYHSFDADLLTQAITLARRYEIDRRQVASHS